MGCQNARSLWPTQGAPGAGATLPTLADMTDHYPEKASDSRKLTVHVGHAHAEDERQ